MNVPVTALILGGTSEARALASALVAHGVRVVSSLAGRVSNPRLPEGEVRIGGFDGPEGLAAWLVEHHAVVVDATHPFAARISTSAVAAPSLAGTELLRLERPGWQQQQGDRWHWVDSLDAAAAALSELGERVLLTSGRQDISAFADRAEHWFLARCVDTPRAPTWHRQLERVRSARIGSRVGVGWRLPGVSGPGGAATWSGAISCWVRRVRG